MPMRVRKIIFFLVSLPLLVGNGGCQKTQLLGEYYLDDFYYSNPYQGYEKLVFKSSHKTEINFLGEGRYSTIHKAYVSVNSNDYYLWESDIVSYISGNDQYRISVYMKASKYESENRLIQGWRDYLSDTTGFVGASTANRLPLNQHNLLSQNRFLDSLVVGEKVYHNVYVDSTRVFRENMQPIDSSFFFPTIIYYNTTEGILKFDFNDGSTWELSHIENR
jgi:hypothetical protein